MIGPLLFEGARVPARALVDDDQSARQSIAEQDRARQTQDKTGREAATAMRARRARREGIVPGVRRGRRPGREGRPRVRRMRLHALAIGQDGRRNRGQTPAGDLSVTSLSWGNR